MCNFNVILRLVRVKSMVRKVLWCFLFVWMPNDEFQSLNFERLTTGSGGIESSFYTQKHKPIEECKCFIIQLDQNYVLHI